ncbi:MAG: phosphoglycerate mutase family protein [bacterium]
MSMPADLVLVRHGNSEGNVAVKASKNGDDHFYSPEFLERHSSKWRLTDRGRREATAAGAWLRKNFRTGFDRHITSEYTRALETAVYLALPNANWYREFYLRERDRGVLDVMPSGRINTEFAELLRSKKRSQLFFSYPGGESMATVCLRIDRVLHTLHRECSGKRALIVCHGESMWAFRLRLERMTQEEFVRLDESENKTDSIWNGQILHYSRRNPTSGEIEPHLNWLRMIRADDPTFSRDWRRIERHKFGNDELMQLVSETPQIVNES